MTCLIISSPPSTSQKKRKNARQRRSERREQSPAYGEPQQQQLDEVLKRVDVIIGAKDVRTSMQIMIAPKENIVVPPIRSPPRHETPSSATSESPNYQNLHSKSNNLPTRRAPPPPSTSSIEEPFEEPPDLPMDNIVISKKGDPYISMKFCQTNGGQLVDTPMDQPSTSKAITNHGYVSVATNNGYESVVPRKNKDKDKPLPAIPMARTNRRRQTSDSDTEVEQNCVKFREWDRQKEQPSIIGTTIYEYVASKKDEVSFKRGSVVEVVRDKCGVAGFAYAEVEGQRGIIPKHFVNLIGEEGRKINPQMLQRGALIGDGGFSAVYRANYSGREVAMKIPKPVNRSYQQIRDALKQEAAFLNIFDHPNIVGFIGVSLEEPLCILLELCEGQSLKSLCKEAKNVPTKTITIWAKQVAIGMSHMHSKNPPVLHRDLKADNILVKERPCLCGQDSPLSKSPVGNYDVNGWCKNCYGMRLDKLILKIADMGLARTQSTARQSTSGSTPWMAPEFIVTQKMTTKSEIWSFGVFLWEIITKETPYAGADAQPLLFAIGTNQIKLPIPENCPDLLKTILEGCWEKKYDDRPSFDKVVKMLDDAQNSLDSNYRIVLNNKTKFDIEELINYVNSRKIDMSAMPILRMDMIPEAPPVKREKKKKEKKEKKEKRHIDKIDIGAPIDMKHWISVKREDEEDFSTSPTRQKPKLNFIRYYEDSSLITEKRWSKDDLDAGRKTPMDPAYDTSTLPRAKLGTTMSKNRGSDGNLSRHSFLSTPDLIDLFRSIDPAKVPQRNFEEGSAEDVLRRESSRALLRKPAFRKKKHHSGSSNNSLAMMNQDALLATISGTDENGFGVVLNSSLDDASSILLSTATNSPITDLDIRDGLVDPPSVIEIATEEDYTERRARLNTIGDLPADVVATPRRAARTGSTNSSTFYLTLNPNGRTSSYSSLQDANIDPIPIHTSREQDKKKNKVGKIFNNVKRIFTSMDKSEADHSYHSKQSSADQSSILSVDHMDYLQEDDDGQDQSAVSKIAYSQQLPNHPIEQFVSYSPQGRPQTPSSDLKNKIVGSSTPTTGHRVFKKNNETPEKIRQRLRTSKEASSTPSTGTPNSLLRTPPTNRRPSEAISPTTPSRSPSTQPRFSIDTVVEFNNTRLPSPTTIQSPTSVAPRLDRSLATSASNLHRLDSPDSVPVEIFHQRSKSSDQSVNQEMILFENSSYVSLKEGTYQKMKKDLLTKPNDPPITSSNSGYIALNPHNGKSSPTPRLPPPPPASTVVPTLPIKLPPSRSPMADKEELKPPPIPPRPVGGNRTSSNTSLLNVVIEFQGSSPSPTSPSSGPLPPRSTVPTIQDSNKPRPSPSPSRLHSPPASISTPPTPPRLEQPAPQRPKTLNLRPSHSPKTPESGLGSTIPSSATNESLKNVVNEPPKKILAKNAAKDNIPRRHDYIMLTDCSTTIPPSHFKSQAQVQAQSKPVPMPRSETPQKKYQTEQHPKAQQRVIHTSDLPRSTAPTLPRDKSKSPKPARFVQEVPHIVPKIPMMLKEKNAKK